MIDEKNKNEDRYVGSSVFAELYGGMGMEPEGFDVLIRCIKDADKLYQTAKKAEKQEGN